MSNEQIARGPVLSIIAELDKRDVEIERLREDLKNAEWLDGSEQVQAEIERLRGLVDACAIYLKEDETPAQRIERERADTEAVLKLLLKEKRDVERLRGLLRETLWCIGMASEPAFCDPDIVAKAEPLYGRVREALGE